MEAKVKGLPASTILVDTSLLIEQQKREELSRPIRIALAPYRFRGASSYSKLEFKRAWLKRLGFLHQLCREPTTRSIGDIHARLAKTLSNPFQRRTVQTCLDALARFLSASASSLSDSAHLARLRAHCKNAVLSASEALKEMATGEFQGTRCVRAEELPKEHPDGSLDVTIRRCTPQRIQCAVHTFFKENELTFNLIAQYIAKEPSSSDELRGMVDHIRLAQKSPVHLCDDKHCSKIADALIAVDGKNMDEFAANNNKEWVPISRVMRKPLLNPVTGERFEVPQT